MTELRKYQRTAVDSALELLRAARSTVLVAPTGSGKTVMGSHIATQFGGRVLWVAHRVELLRQARDHLAALGCDVGILCGAEKENVDAPILVVSVETARHAEGGASLVVVDESHRIDAKSYQAIIDAQQAPVLGLTATPWRLDGRGLHRSFDEMIVAAQPSELIRDGHIAKPTTYAPTQEQAMRLVKGVKSQAGDYAQGELGAAMSDAKILGDVVEERERLAGDRKTIVFAVTVEHSRKLVARFRKAGRTSEVLHGGMSKTERDVVVSRFRSGETQIVVNVDVLTEGFDLPDVQCVSIARPTRSLTRHLQYIGRALRKHGDETPIVIDHVGNSWRHGLAEWDREWSLADRPKGKQGRDSAKLVRRCQECGAIAEVGATRCDACGATFEIADRTTEDVGIRLEEVVSGANRTASLMKRECEMCGVSFKKRQSVVAAGNGRYCSMKCMGDARRTVPPIVCEACGSTFRANHGSRKFCSRKCYADAGRHTMSCLRCDREFSVRRSQGGAKKYCSQACSRAASSRKVFVTCALCGGEFLSKPSLLLRGRGKFCSPSCRSKFTQANRRIAEAA